MAVILNASTSSGLVQTADTSGELVLQNNGTTRLTVNASGVTIPTLTTTTVTGTITQGTAVASTSGTSIDFTGIPSWAKKITVMFNGVSTSGTSNKLIQIGSGSITTTGYNSGSTYLTNGVVSTTSTAGFVMSTTNNGATDVFSGNFVINNVSSNLWVASFSMGFSTNSGGSYVGGGNGTLSGALDRVRITTVNGTDTFDAGSINILYEG